MKKETVGAAPRGILHGSMCPRACTTMVPKQSSFIDRVGRSMYTVGMIENMYYFVQW